uniref:Uncharacterized protein n=1 Tax=Electrophorus electricus TaxID=8005 RepID=A0A4W4GL87_ELEEL
MPLEFYELSSFVRRIAIVGRLDGVSFSKTTGIVGFSHTLVLKVYQERCDCTEISNKGGTCARKQLVGTRSQADVRKVVHSQAMHVLQLTHPKDLFCSLAHLVYNSR